MSAAFSTQRAPPTVVLMLSFGALIPHCICRNPVNAWWMDRLGSSPMCLGWGFVAAVVVVSSALVRARPWHSFALAAAINGGTFGFFVTHHYFHFPW